MMTAFNLTEDQAITAITVGVDFSVSQVVNGNWGMQTIIPKVCISGSHPSISPHWSPSGCFNSSQWTNSQWQLQHADQGFSRLMLPLTPGIHLVCTMSHLASLY